MVFHVKQSPEDKLKKSQVWKIFYCIADTQTFLGEVYEESPSRFQEIPYYCFLS